MELSTYFRHQRGQTPASSQRTLIVADEGAHVSLS